MPERKIVAVVGATGTQGGGLVRTIANDPNGGFAARAITRNPASDKATALASLGVEVVAADLDDVGSLERAFAGAHAAYCVTNFWEHMSVEKEVAQASNEAMAAKQARVEHVIWSTLEDTRRWVPLADDRMPTLGGKYKVPHFDGKGEADHVFTNLGVPTTFLLTSFYWENLVHFGMGPKPGPGGTLLFTLPMAGAKLPGIAAEDIGKCAYGVLKRGPAVIGQRIGIAGEHLTGAEMATALAEALDREVRYNDVSAEAYRGLGFPGADDLGNMFQFKCDFQDVFCRPRSVEGSRALNPELLSFGAWLAKNKDRIEVE